MDSVSAAASGIAVVSLAIQLAENIKQLYEFWESIREAPREICDLVEDLRLLSEILSVIQADEHLHGPSAATDSILRNCMGKVEELTKLSRELEERCNSKVRRKRVWGAIKTSLQSGKLEKFRKSLEETKTSLILAQQSRLLRLNHQNHLGVIQSISELRSCNTLATSQPDASNDWFNGLRAEMIKLLPKSTQNPILQSGTRMAIDHVIEYLKKNPQILSAVMDTDQGTPTNVGSPKSSQAMTTRRSRKGIAPRQLEYWSGQSVWVATPFGMIYLEYKTWGITYGTQERENTAFRKLEAQRRVAFKFHPAQWLLNAGLKYGIKAVLLTSFAGWKNQLDLFRCVPDDALIFEFCKKGNLDGVRTLLSRGQASVYDTDSFGYRPLHFAAEMCEAEICKLLLDSGADPMATTTCTWTALTSCVHSLSSNRPSIDTLRLLADKTEVTAGEYDQETPYLWNLFIPIVVYGESSRHLSWTSQTEWLIGYYQTDLRENFNLGMASVLITELSRWPETSLLKRILDVAESAGFHFVTVYSVKPDFHYLTMKYLLDRYPIILHMGGQTAYGVHQTMTFNAMRSSFIFYRWRSFVRDILQIGMDVFVRDELPELCAFDPGWTEETLLDLLEHDYEPVPPIGNGFCEQCHTISWFNYSRNLKEPWWEERLEMIKNGQFPRSKDVPAGRRDIGAVLQESHVDESDHCREQHVVEPKHEVLPICRGCWEENMRAEQNIDRLPLMPGSFEEHDVDD